MDADGHGIVVGMVGFSMALMGFVLSLVAPVVHSVYPRFHQQLPVLMIDQQVRHHAQQRVVSPTSRDVGKREGSINKRTSLSPSGSANSVGTAEYTAASSVTNATSLRSDGKHAEERGRKEEAGTSSVDKSKVAKEIKRSVSATHAPPCSPRACIARVAGIRSRSYSKPKRAGSTSTATSTSSADVPHQSLGRGRSRMADSPTSSTLNLPSRSSSELDVNYVLAPLSPVLSQQNEGKEESIRKPGDRPRPLSRAKTFFNIGRSSSKRRQAGPTNPPPSGPLPPLPIRAATFADSHSSISPDHPVLSASQQIPSPSAHISSETPTSNLNRDRVNEHGVITAVDEAHLGMERSKSITISCLGKFKGKKKTSIQSLSKPSHNIQSTEVPENVQDCVSDDVTPPRRSRPSSPRSQSERPTSLHLPSPTGIPNISQLTPRPSKKQSKKSNSPPSRTRPYEAPYFFPMPTSPDAVDYARRTRNEYVRTQSGLSQERPNTIHGHNEVKVTTSKADKRKSEIAATDRDLKTAPAHRVGFHFPLHFHRSHKRATSLSSPISPPVSPTEDHSEVDELGFVRPAQELRVRKLKDETAPLTNNSIVRSATLPGNNWRTNGDSSRTLRPLTVKGASQ